MGKMRSDCANLTDQKFGRLYVLFPVRFGKRYKVKWACVCDCGNGISVEGGGLRRGTGSCGCLQKEKARQSGLANHRHGLTGTHTWYTWQSMKSRCLYRGNIDYWNYGGRGIIVCERWLTFENFYADMGERPEGQTIDRINMDGNYEPGNCRWATHKQQANNKRSNRFLTHNGQTMTINQWAKIINISSQGLGGRFKRGWSTEKALTTKKRKENRHARIAL